MKRLFTFSLLCLHFLTLNAQILTFQGQVVDATTQTGIPYVNIGFPKQSIGTSSNEMGAFVIKISKDSSKVMVVSLLPFDKKKEALEVVFSVLDLTLT